MLIVRYSQEHIQVINVYMLMVLVDLKKNEYVKFTNLSVKNINNCENCISFAEING